MIPRPEAFRERLLDRAMPELGADGKGEPVIMLNLDATDIAFKTSKIGAGVSVGPSLLRTALPVHTQTRPGRSPAGQHEGAGGGKGREPDQTAIFGREVARWPHRQ